MPRRPPLTGTGAVCFRKQHRVEHLHASSFFHGCYSLWRIPRRGIPRSEGLSILGPRVERLGPLASRGTTRPRTRGPEDPRTRGPGVAAETPCRAFLRGASPARALWVFAPSGGQAGSQWQLTVNDVSQRGQEQPLDVKKKPKEKETQGKFPALVFDIGFAGSLPALPGAADTRRGQGTAVGSLGRDQAGSRGGEAGSCRPAPPGRRPA